VRSSFENHAGKIRGFERSPTGSTGQICVASAVLTALLTIVGFFMNKNLEWIGCADEVSADPLATVCAIILRCFTPQY
jgi:hypothetical protein